MPTLAYIYVFLLTSHYCHTQLTIQQPPVIWRRTNEKPAVGGQVLHFNIHLNNPCEILAKIQTTQTKVIDSLLTSCTSVYEEKVLDKLNSINYLMNRDVRFRRATSQEYNLLTERATKWSSTRSVITRALKGLGMGLGGIGAKAAAAAAASLVTHPVGWALLGVTAVVVVSAIALYSVAKVQELTLKVDQLDKRVDGFITQVQANFDEIEKKMNDLSNDYTEFKNAYPTMTHLTSRLMSEITLSSHLINRFKEDLEAGEVSSSLFRALNITVPCKASCPFKYMQPLLFQAKNRTHVVFTVDATIFDGKASILRADPFTLSLRNDTHECDQEYSGPQHLVHVQRGPCHVHKVRQTIGNLFFGMEETCFHPNESSWEIKTCRPYDGIDDNFQVKRTEAFNHIYCPGRKILVTGSLQDCPNYVFQLDRTTSFTIGSVNYTGEEIESIQQAWEILQNARANVQVLHSVNPYLIKLEKLTKEYEQEYEQEQWRLTYVVPTVVGACALTALVGLGLLIWWASARNARMIRDRLPKKKTPEEETQGTYHGLSVLPVMSL